MTDAYVHIDGQRVTRLKLSVGNQGPWSLEADLEGDPVLTGRVTTHVGALELVGTALPTQTGQFGLQTRTRIVAGAGGWANELARKHYHNDGGIKARTIAEDAAREAGEQLGNFVPAAERVGIDFVRDVGQASAALEAAIGGVAWYVDYQGVTHVGGRPAAEVSPEAYKVLSYDPRTRWATLSVDDPGAVQIGSIISEGLELPGAVRALELTITPEELRVAVWLGGSDNERSRLAALMHAIIQRSTDGRLHGVYRYRVVKMAGDRVELQAVRQGAGLPDVRPISMWPGVAGVHAELAPGAEVLVQFLEGDRTQPIITGFAGKDGKGFVPTRITIGGPEGADIARKGDTVEVLLTPFVASGTINTPTPTPFTAVFSSTTAKLLGTIVVGSSKAGAAP